MLPYKDSLTDYLKILEIFIITKEFEELLEDILLHPYFEKDNVTFWFSF